MNQEAPQPGFFHQAYQGQPPWDVGHAQRALVDIAPRVAGSILDVGCGTGDNAIFFAQRGHTVYGIDFVEEAIEPTQFETSPHVPEGTFTSGGPRAYLALLQRGG